MTLQERRHWIVEHLWRALRALCILIGTALWLYVPGSEHIVMFFFICAVVVDQLHGLICNTIQRVLHWKEDFNRYE
jgi:hypothetical protein